MNSGVIRSVATAARGNQSDGAAYFRAFNYTQNII